MPKAIFSSPAARARTSRSEPACDHPECAEAGLYRAPKGRDRLHDYFWFCLDHVRDYNKAWNYYEGMSEPEIEAHIRKDTVWDRPTWPLGQWCGGKRRMAEPKIHDGFADFSHGAEQRDGRSDAGAGRSRDQSASSRPRTDEDRALAVLELRSPATLQEIKLRYKSLVKRFHPDANGGDRAAEERLKVINQAYSTLKNSVAFS